MGDNKRQKSYLREVLETALWSRDIRGEVEGAVEAVLDSLFGIKDEPDIKGKFEMSTKKGLLEELLDDLERCNQVNIPEEDETSLDDIAIRIAYDESHPFWYGGMEFDTAYLDETTATFSLIYALSDVLADGLDGDTDEIARDIMRFVVS